MRNNNTAKFPKTKTMGTNCETILYVCFGRRKGGSLGKLGGPVSIPKKSSRQISFGFLFVWYEGNLQPSNKRTTLSDTFALYMKAVIFQRISIPGLWIHNDISLWSIPWRLNHIIQYNITHSQIGMSTWIQKTGYRTFYRIHIKIKQKLSTSSNSDEVPIKFKLPSGSHDFTICSREIFLITLGV